MKENNYNKDVVIKKMTQKFELNPNLAAATQLKKTEFNLEKKRVYLFYHYEGGMIQAMEEQHKRDDLIT